MRVGSDSTGALRIGWRQNLPILRAPVPRPVDPQRVLHTPLRSETPENHRLDNRARQPEHAVPYPRVLHPVSASRFRNPEEARNVGSRRGAAADGLLSHPRKCQGSQKEGALVTLLEGSAVAVGIGAAVAANHHVAVRRPEAGRPGSVVDDFAVPPTFAGMALAKSLVCSPDAVAVVEPTSITWLPLSTPQEPRHTRNARSSLRPVDPHVPDHNGSSTSTRFPTVPLPSLVAGQQSRSRVNALALAVHW